MLLVTDAEQEPGQRPWYRVLIPERPNGKQGWVRGGDVKVVRLHDRIEIDLSEYRLEHFRDDDLVDRFKVGIGEPQWPSPIGEFYVWAKVPQPGSQGAYGVYALGPLRVLAGAVGLAGRWSGGDPRDDRSLEQGKKVSHGCIRVFNPDMEKLRHVPMGTPVIITK